MSNPIQPPGNYPSRPEELIGAPTVQTPPPPSVVNAVRLVVARVVLALVGVVVTLGSQDAMRSAMVKASPTLDQSSLDLAVKAAVGVSVVAGVVFAIVSGVLAWLLLRGKNWARIVVWVFAGISVVLGLVGLAQAANGLNLAVGLLDLCLDVAIIVLLARRSSAAFFGRR
jgi:hypothetical protein